MAVSSLLIVDDHLLPDQLQRGRGTALELGNENVVRTATRDELHKNGTNDRLSHIWPFVFEVAESGLDSL